MDAPPLPTLDFEPPPSPDFTPEELHKALSKGKTGKSVGGDGVSLELLRATAEQPEGETELLRWVNSILHTGDMPSNWTQSIMVLLPKITRPVRAAQSRPISISSATERAFSRMVLSRCQPLLALRQSWQTSGPHKQTADYLHAIYKMFECEREWNKGISILKIDLSPAFDTVCRAKLLTKLRMKLGETEEYRAWHRLLTDTSTTLCSAWGQSSFATRVGIRQGAVESPQFFACVIEWALEETIDKF